MIKASILSSLLLLTCSLAVAESKKISGVSLSDTVSFPNLENTTLKSVDAALRQKKVAFLNFDVYVAEILLPPTTAWDKKSSTFEGSSTAGIMMTFLRDVPGKDVSAAFAEGLKKNSVSTDTAAVQDFLKKVASLGDIKKNEVLSLVRLKKEKEDILLVQVSSRFSETIISPTAWTTGILQIWSGKPSDPGLQSFKLKIFN